MTEFKLNAKPYTEIEPILASLPSQGDDYDYLLIHCYAHIKNAEIYYEIDKDIYMHIVTYVGNEFFNAVKQYFFKMKLGAILAYKKNEAPKNLHLSDFSDPWDDYSKFKDEIDSLILSREKKPSFVLLFDGETAKVLLFDSKVKDYFAN